MHNQLATELEPRDGRRGLVISASKELEPGFRAMLLLAENLFRLDVVVRGDSLQAIVRDLAGGGVLIRAGPGAGAGRNYAWGDVAAYQPGHAQLEFTLGGGDDRLLVKLTIATLRFADRGTVSVSGQAIARQTSAT